ncbi:hypothetical protein CG50_13755 [Paenirhodobacter enshiensis]|uniref:Uncharacterized protein n=1 Tax=Paenirhodobacter enshiensis TaxID=1105367 RepID=A0A086XQ53_9RHOB|nr:hypothetical protein CG50_13755 [Paenirhodobacter enshiensis]
MLTGIVPAGVDQQRIFEVKVAATSDSSLSSDLELIRFPKACCGSLSLEFEHFGFSHARRYDILAQALIAVPAGRKEIVPSMG